MRRTDRLVEIQTATTLEIGGEAARRTLTRQGMGVSATTLIKGVRHWSPETIGVPTVLGIDDWAKRKGHHYGTILVDLETHQPVDLLPTRDSETVAAWLKSHPGIEIISRDRGREYIKAIVDALPEATIVADRWHLLKNLREAVEMVLDAYPAARLAAATPPLPEPTPTQSTDALPSVPEPPTIPLTKVEQQKVERQARRRARFDEVHALRQQGYTISEIERRTHLTYRTVQRYLAVDTCPQYDRSPESYYRKLKPYIPYLEEQWLAGCTNASQLFRDIQTLGFSGSRGLVSDWAVKKRQQLPPAVRLARRQTADMKPFLARQRKPKPVSAVKASWLLFREQVHLQADEIAMRDRLLAAAPKLVTLDSLVKRFLQMTKQRTASLLDPWLNDVDIANFGTANRVRQRFEK